MLLLTIQIWVALAIGQKVNNSNILSSDIAPHMETMNRELQERMKAMREGNSNGLKPAGRRKLNDSWNASQVSSSAGVGGDPAAEIERLASRFGAAQVHNNPPPPP